MARPQKSRRICSHPGSHCFRVVEGECEVVLGLDEFESIRLLDYEKMTQEECARQMEVARATVTLIYESAREKIAEALVQGKTIRIAGGNVRICERAKECVGRCGQSKFGIPVYSENIEEMRKKGMTIAVTYEEGQIFQHFGHTAEFKLYEVKENQIISSKVIGTNGNGHEALAGYLNEGAVAVLICGGIGGGAIHALSSYGIQVVPGASGDADEAVQAFLEGKLLVNPVANCNHHGEGHTCGEHSCH